jgi:hypothetical protein
MPDPQGDEEREYCKLLRYCEKIDRLEKMKESEIKCTKFLNVSVAVTYLT